MYSVYQHWDPLKVCVVGRSYPPQFYSFIENPRLREMFEKIAMETEEDYQLLISTLKKFDVEIVRPNVPSVQVDKFVTKDRRIPGPISMNPRDQMIMIGDRFFVYPYDQISVKVSGRNIPFTNWTPRTYDMLKGEDWPQDFQPYEDMPLWIQEECKTILNFEYINGEDPDDMLEKSSQFSWWSPITDNVSKHNEVIYNKDHDILKCVSANGITRIGKDLYFGVNHTDNDDIKKLAEIFFQEYRCHFITTGGHVDGCFTPIVPGLIVSIRDIPTYEKTFPNWEVVYLEGESWNKVRPFLDLKKKNKGRWWIKGSEYDDELIEYVETWLKDWVGYVEESVFDVNILVIDEKNIVVNGYNKIAFDAFARYGITPHICPMRHRYFWDGGVHCVTLDLHREGSLKDYFPERG